MNINLHNYELYFIQYQDGELDEQQRLEVEQFVAEHPELQEEWNLLMDSRLTVTDTPFPKENLYRAEAGGLEIRHDNHEEIFLLYVDGELDPASRTAVETFAEASPAYRQELELLKQAVLQPDLQESLGDKSFLYRHEEKKERPVLYMRWMKYAAAAAILLLFGTYWLNRPVDTTDGTEPAREMAQVKPASPAESSDARTSIATGETSDRNSKAIAQADESNPDEVTAGKQESSRESGSASPNADASDAVYTNRRTNGQDYAKNETGNNSLIAVTKPDESRTTFVSEPKREVKGLSLDIPDLAPVAETETSIAASTTAPATQPAYVEVPEAETDNIAILTASGNAKGPLRGITRKTGRLLNRLTGKERDKEDHERKVKVASFAVSL